MITALFMGFHRLQLKLWILGLVGFGWLWAGLPAVADSTGIEAVTMDPEVVASPAVASLRSGHDCYNLAIEEPEPLGEFRQAALETAAVAARAIDTVEEKADALASLSEAYACLGQVDLADAIAQETLPLIEEIEDVSVQGSLLVTLARMYGENLGDLERMAELLPDVIASAEGAPQDSVEQRALINNIVQLYSSLGEYEEVRAVIDIVDDLSTREELIWSNLWFLQTELSDDEKMHLFEVFPELEVSPSADSLLPGDVELSPLQNWLLQFPRQISIYQGEEQDDFFDAQISEIESFPDIFAQAYGYTTLGSYLWHLGYQEQAIFSLETAVQKVDELQQQAEMPDNVSVLTGAASLEGFLGATLIQVGDFDRGLSMIREIDSSSPESLANRVSFFVEAARMLSFETKRETEVDALMMEAEQTARSAEDPDQYLNLSDIAFAHVELGNVEAARRLVNELLEKLKSGEFVSAESYVRSGVVYMLFAVGSYEEGMDVLSFVDEPEVFSDIASLLIEQGEDDLAWQVYERVTSPVQQIQALVYMAQTYQDLGQLEIAMNLAIQAIERFNSADFTQLDYFNYGYMSSADISEDEVVELVESVRRGVLDGILYLPNSDAEMQVLIQLIEDDAIRNYYLGLYFPPEAENESVLPTNDYDLRSLAGAAAREEQFQEAVAAVAMMDSPAQQSHSLRNIATCYAYSTTVLDADTAAGLAQIRQRYQ